ncbi:sensor histidine kinase [Massilia horti]|nr:sensor histidine kinase [Massilia horti]
MLALLAACGPALAAPARLSAPVSAALLILLVVGAAFCLGWHKIRSDDRAAEADDRLEQERDALEQAERELADSHSLLCKLVLEQAGVRDAERSRIARDIHDDLGQTLLSLRVDMSLLELCTSTMHPTAHEKISDMGTKLDYAIRTLRVVINDLRPLGLGEGLRAAIERQLAEFSRVTGITHCLDVNPEALAHIAGQRALEAILYRVTQEALANVARHSHASRVRVSLHSDGERLMLRVQDDGVGLAAGALERGYGLAGMRERARIACGELSIERGPGGGTVLALCLPLVKETVAG